MVSALLVHTHPVADSLGAAVRDAAVDGLRRSGAAVDVIDLYADGFHMRCDDATIREHIERLRACDLLVLVYPTWWGAQPALLRSWFERVWSHSAALGPGAPLGTAGQRFSNVDRLVAVTTHGSPWWINAVQGESGKRFVRRTLRRTLAPRARVDWLAHYDLDHERLGDTQRFLERVSKHLARSA